MPKGEVPLTRLARDSRRIRYQKLFDSIRDALFVCGMDTSGFPGTFTEVNESACKLLGYSRKELIGKKPDDFIHLRPGLNARKLTATVLTKKEVLFEADLIARSGIRIPVEVHAGLLDVEGDPTILSAVRDISERKLISSTPRPGE